MASLVPETVQGLIEYLMKYKEISQLASPNY